MYPSVVPEATTKGVLQYSHNTGVVVALVPGGTNYKSQRVCTSSVACNIYCEVAITGLSTIKKLAYLFVCPLPIQ